ncbi:hypothetical protein ROZALSC1DRAFT_28095 [Rozella allomycis CSF55]|uniref:Uncharacterized protein n=1 Tax=Rozella allomycis (strain CSF55) TaxID=988480 RepID=A0A4P9YL91_ROZAC|nr:hypothetical protein ROZALSC1DRAFT_28095 [Rozella allomycis CSF55]
MSISQALVTVWILAVSGTNLTALLFNRTPGFFLTDKVVICYSLVALFVLFITPVFNILNLFSFAFVIPMSFLDAVSKVNAVLNGGVFLALKNQTDSTTFFTPIICGIIAGSFGGIIADAFGLLKEKPEFSFPASIKSFSVSVFLSALTALVAVEYKRDYFSNIAGFSWKSFPVEFDDIKAALVWIVFLVTFVNFFIQKKAFAPAKEVKAKSSGMSSVFSTPSKKKKQKAA